MTSKKQKDQEVVNDINEEVTAVINVEELNDIEEDLDATQITEANLFLTEDTPEGFLPEATENESEIEMATEAENVEGSELEAFESAQIEDLEFVEEEQDVYEEYKRMIGQ